MRIHLKLTYFPNPSISKIFFIFFISFHFPPCFSQDALHEFKACGVNYNGRDLVNISHPDFCRRPKFNFKCEHSRATTIGINSSEYNVMKINQSDHRITITKVDRSEDFCPRNQIETATLDYHLFMYSSSDRNISVWYDCPQQEMNWENYRFPCGSREEKEGKASYVFETSREIGGCKMKIEVTVTMKGLEGGKNKTVLLEKAARARRWFNFKYRNLYVIKGLEGRKNGMALSEKAGGRVFNVEYKNHTTIKVKVKYGGRSS